jgi:erythromycin esterase-like protein
MTTAEKILAEVRTLPEAQAREVLDFVAFLKSRLQRKKSAQQDVSAFDRFGAVYEGQFNRDELTLMDQTEVPPLDEATLGGESVP